MKNKFTEIKELLSEIEASYVGSEDQYEVVNFDALEVPSIICDVVDFLQPELTSYESAIYWHMFRKSVLANGQQYTRVSVRGLRSGVIQSDRGKSKDITYSTVQKALRGLEEKNVISKAGDTTKDGTPYKIYLPEQIELCVLKMKEYSKKEVIAVDEKKELDYYNNSENRLKVFERDDYKCKYCNKKLTRFSATLDHIQPVSKGGDNSFGNLTTSCLHCNSQRGNKPIMEWLNLDNEK